jgi:hypothetical protein
MRQAKSIGPSRKSARQQPPASLPDDPSDRWDRVARLTPRIDLVRHNFVGQNGCDNGFHKMDSDAPFGLTVWGWGSAESLPFESRAVSYAYPAGASVQFINPIVVNPRNQ